MLEKLKRKIGMYLLRRYKQTEKLDEFLPIRQARSVGIIYDVELISWKQMGTIIHYFEEKGKSVTTLGYFNDKELNHNYNPNFKHMFFCNEQVSFWKLPVPSTLNQFINTRFDYLINLDVEGNMIVQAVSAYSDAKSRFGLYFEEYQFCQDLMIKAQPNSGVELFELMKKYFKNE